MPKAPPRTRQSLSAPIQASPATGVNLPAAKPQAQPPVQTVTQVSGGTNPVLVGIVLVLAVLVVYTLYTQNNQQPTQPGTQPIAANQPNQQPVTPQKQAQTVKGPAKAPTKAAVPVSPPQPVVQPTQPATKPPPLPPLKGMRDLKASLDLAANRLPKACGYLLGGGPNRLSSARFKLVVEVGDDGKVNAKSLTTPPPIRQPIEQCVIDEVMRMQFPGGDGDRSRIHEFALSMANQ